MTEAAFLGMNGYGTRSLAAGWTDAGGLQQQAVVAAALTMTSGADKHIWAAEVALAGCSLTQSQKMIDDAR